MNTQTFAEVGIEIPLGRSGEVDLLCPQCSAGRKPEHQRHRCLSVNTVTGVWHCANCEWSGGLHRPGASYGAPLPKITYAMPPPLPPADGLTPEVLAWFAKRAIPEDVVRLHKITAGSVFIPQLDREANAIHYPYFRDGELVNVKYRAHPKHFRMAKGAEPILYGLDRIGDADVFCLVEGEMDALAIETANGWPALSVPNGATAGRLDYLASSQDIFDRAKTVVLATDADEPGQKLADELARRIGPEKCRKVAWRDGCKDANEVLVKHGAEALCQDLADAQPYPVDGIFTPRELYGAFKTLYERGYDYGLGVGWFRFDRFYRTRAGLMTIVTGIPGSGKSAWLDNLIVRLAEQHGWGFGLCSPENQPLERHMAGIAAITAGLPFTSGPTTRMTWEEAAAAESWMEGRINFVLPEEPTVDAILERARVLVYRDGIRGLVVDPWNELEHSRPSGMTETEYVSSALTRFRSFARRHGVHVWLVAHPTKMQKVDGEYPVPTPYDISGSAHWYNKADACISVWRDVTDAMVPTQIHVQKIRFAETGERGMVEFRYDRATGRFSEA